MSNFRCSNALFNGTIIINTTAGATVTATTTATSRVFTAVANAGGVATIPVKKRGTYAIASTGTTRIGHATVLTTASVTAVYNWEKWECGHTYLKASDWASTRTRADGEIYIGGVAVGGYIAYVTPNNEPDTSTGLWYFSNQLNRIVDSHTSMKIYNCNVAGYPDSRYTNHVYHVYSTYSTSIPEVRIWAAGYAVIYITSAGAPYTVTHYYSYITYWKGSTSYGVVTSPTLGAHPANGRDGNDGYWYVEL